MSDNPGKSLAGLRAKLKGRLSEHLTSEAIAAFYELPELERCSLNRMMGGAIAVMLQAALGKHADRKWVKMPPQEHIDHAIEHLRLALNKKGGIALDDDKFPHLYHAAARIVLAIGVTMR